MARAACRRRAPSWRVIRLPRRRRTLVLVAPGVAGVASVAGRMAGRAGERGLAMPGAAGDEDERHVMNPARTLGPGIVGADLTGWRACVVGDIIGAAIAVVIIILVRGLPVKEEPKPPKAMPCPAPVTG